ncbi:MAG TPA: hypothetical protein EYP59_02185 [Thiotrichaceae bacterium]|nr:hypothetical protein [Thiotrichaceae bacterium]
MKTIDNNAFNDNIFEERAENLSKQELMTWSVETAQDQNIIKKLQGTGTKLLSGPRGSGKSTLLRKAYFSLLDSGKILPVYVNYSQSLALEPLFHNHANALQIFHGYYSKLLSVLVRHLKMPNQLCLKGWKNRFILPPILSDN